MTIMEIMQQAKALSAHERKELVKMLIDTLDLPDMQNEPPKRRLSELRGLGNEL
jgi:hypothetical protein